MAYPHLPAFPQVSTAFRAYASHSTAESRVACGSETD